MITGPILVALALAYVGVLFYIAWAGDRWATRRDAGKSQPLVYALSIGVYCTSWTFFGSVGQAASTGYDFLPVYTGPIICFVCCTPLIRRIIRIARNQNITSVSDFLAARYGNSQAVAFVVTIIAVLTALPYIALQLKAVALSVDVVLGFNGHGPPGTQTVAPVDTGLIVAAAMALFAVLFGTRHADATEHQHGLIMAVAAEFVIKIAAFVVVGVAIVLAAFGDGLSASPGVMEFLQSQATMQALFTHPFHSSFWITVTVLSFIAILLLPRQFHVVVVENNSSAEVKCARWLFPLYLVVINLFVIPIAIAGLSTLPKGAYAPDMFVLALPQTSGAHLLTLIAFVGGVSAATAMVIVETVALALMVSNGLIAPIFLRSRFGATARKASMVGRLLIIRRTAILAIIVLGYGVYRLLGRDSPLASIGLVSFAGIAQLAPAFFIGLFWRRATSLGAIGGIIAGILVWSYTLVLPMNVQAGLVDPQFLTNGPLGIDWLRPQALFDTSADPLTHGVVWSLLTNVVCFVTLSFARQPKPVEQQQAERFVEVSEHTQPVLSAAQTWQSGVSVGELQNTVARYLGPDRAAHAFQNFARRLNLHLDPAADADQQLLRYTEHQLTSAVGAASARLVLSLLTKRHMPKKSALRLLDDASEAVRDSRDFLQSAFDHLSQGICVVDKDMRLSRWNRQFLQLLRLPEDYAHFGTGLDKIAIFRAKRGDFGNGPVQELADEYLIKIGEKQSFTEFLPLTGRILDIRAAAMPHGGIVITHADVTERIVAAKELANANATLEQKVKAATAELSSANIALTLAKARADAANLDKTRFLAAASHDIKQPLHAARLYASSLIEQQHDPKVRQIADRVERSLHAVEEIIETLTEIARLDARGIEAELVALPVQEIFDRLRVEFEPQARERKLELRIVPSTLWVKSDRRMLPRLMQNLVSNAIKYTRSGGVLVGARRAPYGVTFQVADTGPGIPVEQQSIIFKEFQRLPEGAEVATGLGLGLAIVDRISKLLDHRVDITSEVGRGTIFSVTVPSASAGLAPVAPVPAPESHANRLAGLCVLCIDNDSAVLEGMRALLSGWNCHVLTARSAHDAYTVLANSPLRPHVVLADYHLDKGSGLEAIARVRGWERRDIPALVITADTSAELQRLVRDMGFGLLRKPVKVAALRAALTQATVHAAGVAAAE